jgi:hypothetical protein
MKMVIRSWRSVHWNGSSASIPLHRQFNAQAVLSASHVESGADETERTEQEEECMNARRKLNVAYASGSFLLAAVGGYLLNSWVVFVLGLLIALGLNLYDGGIRLDRRDRRR